jgi:Putative enzyme of poly-gamma-glutamate biosynthesis (capsule formation)
MLKVKPTPTPSLKGREPSCFGLPSFRRGWGRLLLFLLLFSCSSGEKEDGLTLLFTGDVLLDRGVSPIAESEGMPYLFEGVADDFARADAVIINLECPLADTLSPLGKQYIFHAPTRYASGLRQAGITYACLANNHTNDQSRRGLRSTARALADAGITPLGYGPSAAARIQPVLIRGAGVTVALFNSVALTLENWVPSDTLPDVCQLRAEALAAVIHDYKAAHPDHYAIAVLHWGAEFQESPSMRQRLGAAALANAGADAIIGHHPHVTQPFELISQPVDSLTCGHVDLKKTPVFFSLGNFVFDQAPPSTRRALMAELVITPDTLTARAIPVTLRRCRPFSR